MWVILDDDLMAEWSHHSNVGSINEMVFDIKLCMACVDMCVCVWADMGVCACVDMHALVVCTISKGMIFDAVQLPHDAW